MTSILKSSNKSQSVPFETEVVKYLKNRYSSPKVECYVPVKVNYRSDNVINIDTDTDRWETNFVRRQENLTKGHFTSISQAFEPIGDVELDTRFLVYRQLMEKADFRKFRRKTIRAQQIAMMRMVGIKSKTEKEARAAMVVEKPLQTDSGTEVPSLEVFKRQCESAGMEAIQESLQESTKRLAAVRAQQLYEHHVKKCQALREELELERNQPDQSEDMVLQAISSMHQLRARTPPGGKKIQFGKPSTANQSGDGPDAQDFVGSQRQSRKRRNLIMKLQSLHILLCSMHNMRPRDLKSRVPLNHKYLEVIRREPATVAEEREKPTINTSTMSHNRPSRPSRTGSIIAAGTLTELLPETLATKRLARRRTKYMFKVLTSFAKQEDRSKSPRMETWEDLLAAGSDKKQESRSPSMMKDGAAAAPGRPRQQHRQEPTAESSSVTTGARRLPPWQNIPSVEKKKAPNMFTMSRELEKELAEEEYRLDHLVENMTFDLLKSKAKLKKQTQASLAKHNREKLPVFYHKFEVFNKNLPLYAMHKIHLNDASEELGQTPGRIERERASWHKLLERESKSAVGEQDEELDGLLNGLGQFALKDEKIQLNGKEKLCLLVMSLSVFDILTAHMQEAIRFVLENVLAGCGELFDQWMAARKLPLLIGQSHRGGYSSQ